MKTDSNPKKNRSVTLSSVLLAKRFSSTLLAPVNRNNVTVTNLNNATETTITTKKQHNPRRHVFSTAGTNENQNPVQLTTISSGEKVMIFILLFHEFHYLNSLASKFS
jgi:ABC-type metal ion transport system substrate-binding protein